MTRIKVRISLNIASFARISPKHVLDILFSSTTSKMAKSFYLWQTVSKKAKWQPCQCVHSISTSCRGGEDRVRERENSGRKIKKMRKGGREGNRIVTAYGNCGEWGGQNKLSRFTL